LAVGGERGAEDGRISAVLLLPEATADDGDGRRADLIIGGRDDAAGEGADAPH
jgi:hypothetical protein